MKLPKKLVIDKARWGRGDENWGMIPDDEDRMCCLGHLAEFCGLDSDLAHPDDAGTPVDIATLLTGDLADVLLKGKKKKKHTKWTEKAMKINDKPLVGVCPDGRFQPYTEEDREQDLIDHFSEIGVKLEFRDSNPKPKNVGAFVIVGLSGKFLSISETGEIYWQSALKKAYLFGAREEAERLVALHSGTVKTLFVSDEGEG